MEVIGAIVVAALSCAQCKGWFITQRRGIGTRSTLQALHVFLVLIPLLKFRHSQSPADAEDIPAPQKFFEEIQKRLDMTWES
ncbi:hypothetical protein ACCUM_0659 [Candidatus Accumulibacter phosphatis]|uniref:Uncharacterized protein n=2 Tax=Candidatus Accumulibacter phosphatis TaxID=327160 RepID=A0A5S4ETB7_9PROT|nr:hypothetical protein ACCUM_0659 [Candidatus Accumulibacter phosphatis]